MKIPKSLTNRCNYLKTKIKPMQDELDQIERALAIFGVHTSEEVAKQNQQAAANSIILSDEPPDFTKRKGVA